MSRRTGLKIFIYNRKSRKDREEERKALEDGLHFDILERHRNRLLEVAKKENHNIVHIFEESNAVSGELIVERPEVQKMLRRIETGEVDALLAVDLDRVGRGDMFDMGMIYRALKQTDTLFLTPTEVIDSNEDGAELYFGIKSLFSHQELKGINKRLQNGRRDSIKEGKHIAKKPPYGYLRTDKLKLYPDPDKAWIIKKIFEMTVTGQGRKNVCSALDRIDEATPPNGGDYWEVSTISSIITNEVYLGHLIWGKIKHIKRSDGSYKRIKLPPEKWTRVDNTHEPIVSIELFEEANLASKGRYRAPVIYSRAMSNPLSGILKCAICGKAMRYQPRKNRPNDAIRCTSTACKGIQKGAGMELVIERVLQGLEHIVSTFEIDDKMHSLEKRDDNDNLLDSINKSIINRTKELEDLNKQKNNLHDLLEKQVYDIETFMERQQIVVTRIKEIQLSVEQLESQYSQEKQRNKNKHEFVPKIKSVLSAYHSTADVEKKNLLLKSILERATYLRQQDWLKKDEFQIQLYPRI